MTADGGHLHLDVNMCWLYAYFLGVRCAGQIQLTGFDPSSMSIHF